MPSDVLEVTKKFMRDPVEILVKKDELTLEGIKQFFVNVEKEVCIMLENKFNPSFFVHCPSLECLYRTSLLACTGA